MSLRTKDEAVAKRRLNSELGKWDALFDELRSRREVSLNDKAVAVWEHYEATLQNYEEKQRAMPTPEQIDGGCSSCIAEWKWEKSHPTISLA
ncbi:MULTISPECIES: DUF6538 domain-containing protein [unclassified Rhizobium]|uniref:DUF6538 domain-containing protein n=1 Tax=unclassified Rhizobium TaxID=2613769 RepID=UPI000ABEED94|nr:MULTISPECIES: DUF6538 domain-containing protein [unclassified Rhizobium]